MSTVKLFDLHLYFEYTVYNSICGGKYQIVEGEHIDNLIDEIIQCVSHKLLLSSGLNRPFCHSHFSPVMQDVS